MGCGPWAPDWLALWITAPRIAPIDGHGSASPVFEFALLKFTLLRLGLPGTVERVGHMSSMGWPSRPIAHFHAYHAGRRASVSIDGTLLAGSLEPRALAFSGNGPSFSAPTCWQTGNAPGGTSPLAIPPLP